MSMQDDIQSLVDRFHRKVDGDENLRKEIEHLDKKFNIDLGTEGYSMVLRNARVESLEPNLRDDADLTITTTPENFRGLIDGTLRPMRAYVMKKVQIKGKIDDLMFLKKFF
ncbi:MAG: SCP2 sterol-binding domain-containing protein [Candidatus Methanomethylophilaceae archaeon]|nr:SCP2 sterol-binding domain-containing protein [Candidatus Methanomethylophilaceae archaeon]